MRDSEKTSLKEASPSFFHYWPESIWLKIKPAGLRSDCVALTDDCTGQSVTSDATCIIQPVFIYVEIELLSAKLGGCSPLLVEASPSLFPAK